MERMEVIVVGRVQGVMYRDFVERHASALSLCGVVENLSDGTVSVCAEGPREKLEKLVAHLKRGPLLARVNDVRVTWTEATKEHKSFSIRQ